MSIEIYEVKVTAKVNEAGEDQKSAETNAQQGNCNQQNRERNEAIAQQTGEILKRRKER